MTNTVQLFAGAREAAGSEIVLVALPDDACVGDVRRALATAVPALERFGSRLWIAVNGEYASDVERLPAGAEIAAFPPVSGG